MDTNSDFQHKIVEYLEGVHVGEFMTGSHEAVQQMVNKEMIDDEYKDPTQTMPEPPSKSCHKQSSCMSSCLPCKSIKQWQSKYKFTVDDILLCSNIPVSYTPPHVYVDSMWTPHSPHRLLMDST
jgi:hypothetical protein